MSDGDDFHAAGGGSDHELAMLRNALKVERRNSMRWEREAVLRASTVAGTLTVRVIAAQRLAATVERNLPELAGGRHTPAAREVQDALELFRDVARNQ